MQFIRAEFLNGAFWQVLTSQVVHLSALHALVNWLMLLLSFVLLKRLLKTSHTLLCLAGGSAGVAFALVTDPNCQYYAGLSGALYGLWAGSGFLMAISHRSKCLRFYGVLIILFVYIKIIYLNNNYYIYDFDIYLPAHQYGSIGGVIFAMFLRLFTSYTNHYRNQN